MKRIKDLLRQFLPYIMEERNPYTSPKNHKSVPKTIHTRWKNWGLNPELLDFTHYSFTGRNVFIPPMDPTKPTVLLMAHHDTVPNSPGVDDNGSGMAVVDVLAYLHSRRHFQRNVCFALVDFEENDPRIWYVHEKWQKISGISWDQLTEIDQETFFRYKNFVHKHLTGISSFTGTRQLLEHLKRNEIQVEVVFNFETVGYTSSSQRVPPNVPLQAEKGDFIALVGNIQAQSWVNQIMGIARQGFTIPLIVPMDGKSLPDTRRSDHSVFWDNQDAAIMLTDTANFRNPNYHKDTDTNIDLEFLAELTTLMFDLLN